MARNKINKDGDRSTARAYEGHEAKAPCIPDMSASSRRMPMSALFVRDSVWIHNINSTRD
jgi:hypothetical protein